MTGFSQQDKVLTILAEGWKSRPNLRLCQLIHNAIRDETHQLSLYDYEDDDLVDRLIAYCRLDVASPGCASRDELAGD